MASEPLRVFIHIPKTAGSSFRAVIERNVLAEQRVNLDSAFGTTLAQALWSARNQMPAAKIVYGHVERRVHEMLGRDCAYFTILRDPVERVLSLYRFIKYDFPVHPMHAVLNAPDMTLRRWIEGRPAMACNVMTKMLSGLANEYEPDTPAMLPFASKALLGLSALGIQERYDESVDLISAAFGWTPVYEDLNRSSVDRQELLEREEVSDATLEMIREANALDVELYADAVAIFDRRVKAERQVAEVLV